MTIPKHSQIAAFRDGFYNYGLSKLAVAALSHELARRIDAERDALVLSCDPGTVNTKMLLAGWGACGIAVDAADDEYALTHTRAWSAHEHGTYFVGCVPTQCEADVYDDAQRAALWALLERVCACAVSVE